LVGVIEEIVRSEVVGNYPQQWDENHITYSILRKLQALKLVEINGLRETFYARWSAFKLSGKAETDLGDIAIVVRINYPDGVQLEGAAFLEAKKRKQNKLTFDELKTSQLRRIVGNAPRSMVLLYDYEDITKFPHNKFMRYGWEESRGLAYTKTTNAVAVATNTVIARAEKDTSLYRFSIPFSRQLCRRYLLGLDLEYEKDLVEAAKGFATRKFGSPTYMMVITVSPDEQVGDLSGLVNSAAYAPIDQVR
jgi:hypothetical protein